MTLKRIGIALSVVALSTFQSACSESPNPAVTPAPVQGVAKLLNQPSVVYSGFIRKVNPETQELEVSTDTCTIQMSVIENNGSPQVIAQLVESIHQVTYPAMVVNPYYRVDDQYVTEAAMAGSLDSALIGFEVENTVTNPDVNELLTYINDVTLKQAFVLRFEDQVDVGAMMTAMNDKLKSGVQSLSAQELDAFDNMGRASVHVQHIGHVDTINCVNMSINEETVSADYSFLDESPLADPVKEGESINEETIEVEKDLEHHLPEVLAQPSVVYQGFVRKVDFETGELYTSTDTCTMQMSVVQEDGNDVLVAKLAETIHGDTYPALELEKYYRAGGQWVIDVPASGFSRSAMIGLEVDESVTDPDVNELFKYIQDGNVVQAFVLRFQNAVDVAAIMETIKSETSSGAGTLSQQTLSTLDKMGRASIHVQHIGHVDTVNCVDMMVRPTLALVDYNFEQPDSHEEGEHEHEGHEQEGHEQEGHEQEGHEHESHEHEGSKSDNHDHDHSHEGHDHD